MTPDALLGGFSDAPQQSARAFRVMLEVLARPGEIRMLTGVTPPAPLSVAAGVMLLTLCDGNTPVHLAGGHDCGPLRDWITFHCGAPLCAADSAMFAVGNWSALKPISRFAVGQPDYPDRSATLIIEMANLSPSDACLTGPGIATKTLLSLPETAAFQENRALFPRGFDAFLTCGAHVAGLPRSTVVEAC